MPDLTVIPISALHGDNVVTRSANSPWYDGPSLLHHLEHVHVASDRNLVDTRFPVQYVIRPQSDAFHDYRGYAGSVASGVLRPGDEVQVLPSGLTTTIAGDRRSARPGRRGVRADVGDRAAAPTTSTSPAATLICRPANAPQVTQDLDAMVCWMTDEPLRPRQRIAVKHTTRTVRAVVKDLQYRLDVNTLHRDLAATELGLNDIGRVRCGPPSRCSSTTTPATGSPAGSSSSTRRPTPPSAPGCSRPPAAQREDDGQFLEPAQGLQVPAHRGAGRPAGRGTAR